MIALPPLSPGRPLWLTTLADLALLLVGFLLLIQALGRDDPARLAQALRAGFGNAQPVAMAAMDGFAPGSAALPRPPSDIAAWAQDVLADPRTSITVTGEAPDTDPASGSSAILAADRARALAAALIAAGAPAERIAVAARTGPRRAAYATLSYSRPD
jgi:hypothetical protein